MPVTLEECAYVAGLFDGEGSLAITGTGKSVMLLIYSSHKPVVEWVASKFEGYVCKHGAKTHKEMWRWECTQKLSCLKFLNNVLPYSIIRKADLIAAKLFLEAEINGHEMLV